LIIDGTRIATFADFNPPPGIEILSCMNTPVSRYPHLSIMAVIVFGPSLRRVNGASVTALVKARAVVLAPRVRDDLLNGFVIVNLQPVRLLNLVTRERKSVFVNLPSNEEPPPGKEVYPEKGVVYEDPVRQSFEEMSAGLLKDVAGEVTTSGRSPRSSPMSRSRRSGRMSALSADKS
jgi:hypothetical protein